ncbi:MAG: universal stress protein [Candidatus Bathyarchaeia archaeon]
MFEKILVPLDGSEHSIKALEIAVQIALKFDGKITLMHVYSIGGLAISPTPVQEFIEAIRRVGARILTDGEKRVKAEGVQAETLLIEGHAVEQIVKTCRESRFDLIVIGARGLGRMKKMLLGSVSEGVTRYACCPVLVVK